MTNNIEIKMHQIKLDFCNKIFFYACEKDYVLLIEEFFKSFNKSSKTKSLQDSIMNGIYAFAKMENDTMHNEQIDYIWRTQPDMFGRGILSNIVNELEECISNELT